MRKYVLIALSMLISCSMWAQVEKLDEMGLSLIPAPKDCSVKNEKMHKLKSVTVVEHSTPLGDDEYGISINKGVANIWGNTVWAKETLRQLTDAKGRVPNVQIHDWASYPIRGFMHDVGRNWQPLDMLKRTIDIMSMYRLNMFHWHLTDNPSWRIECKCYPQLNDPKYQRKGRDEGKFYTYDEIRELFSYAAARGITIMPEIDMPGHSKSFADAMGFSMDSPEGMKVLEQCLDEFFREIPADICPYFHVGSDEVHVTDPEGFARWAQEFAASHDRKVMVWDPGLPVMPGTIRQIWNGGAESNAKSIARHERYVDSFVGYLNYYDPILFTMRTFQHKACGQDKPNLSKGLGGILCLWNDVRVDDKSRIALHNGMVNGMMAFAERFWNGGGGTTMPDENLYPDPKSDEGKRLIEFEKRIANHRDRLFTADEIRWVANAALSWNIELGDTTVKAWGGAIDLDILSQVNNVNTNDLRPAIATTNIYATRNIEITAWLGFDTPARSNRMGTGIGQQLRWENNGEINVNGENVWPEKEWNEPGRYYYNFPTWHKPQEEEPFTDEQLYWMRQPVKLKLHKGKNVIRITIPHAFKNQRWGFGFVPMKLNNKGMPCEIK